MIVVSKEVRRERMRLGMLTMFKAAVGQHDIAMQEIGKNGFILGPCDANGYFMRHSLVYRFYWNQTYWTGHVICSWEDDVPHHAKAVCRIETRLDVMVFINAFISMAALRSNNHKR